MFAWKQMFEDVEDQEEKLNKITLFAKAFDKMTV